MSSNKITRENYSGIMIHKTRQRLDLTLDAVGLQIGNESKANVSRWIRGCRPKEKSMEKILRWLNANIDPSEVPNCTTRENENYYTGNKTTQLRIAIISSLNNIICYIEEDFDEMPEQRSMMISALEVHLRLNYPRYAAWESRKMQQLTKKQCHFYCPDNNEKKDSVMEKSTVNN